MHLQLVSGQSSGSQGPPPPYTPPQLKIPRRAITVPQYRPRAQDFLTNLDSIASRSFGIRRIEPPICERLRSYLNINLKLFHEVVVRDIKRMGATFLTATSDKLPEAIAETKAATEKVIIDYAELADKFAKEINEKCGNLGSVGVLSNVNQKIEQLRATQMDIAKQLAAIPDRYEKEMQSNYVPVEEFLGTGN